VLEKARVKKEGGGSLHLQTTDKVKESDSIHTATKILWKSIVRMFKRSDTAIRFARTYERCSRVCEEKKEQQKTRRGSKTEAGGRLDTAPLLIREKKDRCRTGNEARICYAAKRKKNERKTGQGGLEKKPHASPVLGRGGDDCQNGKNATGPPEEGKDIRSETREART